MTFSLLVFVPMAQGSIFECFERRINGLKKKGTMMLL